MCLPHPLSFRNPKSLNHGSSSLIPKANLPGPILLLSLMKFIFSIPHSLSSLQCSSVGLIKRINLLNRSGNPYTWESCKGPPQGRETICLSRQPSINESTVFADRRLSVLVRRHSTRENILRSWSLSLIHCLYQLFYLWKTCYLSEPQFSLLLNSTFGWAPI